MGIEQAYEVIERVCNSVSVNWQDQQAIRAALAIIKEEIIEKDKNNGTPK